MIRVGLKPHDWLKPAADSFSGLLGGTSDTNDSPEPSSAAARIISLELRRSDPGM
jgi:hypothetical protein